MDDSTRRAMAYHEAGHCVAGYSKGTPLQRVGLHETKYGVPPDGLPLAVALAGRAALERLEVPQGVIDGATISDARDLLGIAASIVVTDFVVHPSMFSDEGEALLKRRSQEFVEGLGDRPLNEARAIMADPRHWRAVEALAEALLERKTIPGDEAHRIIAEAMEGD